jgi:5-methylcytosine-specific restriction endonuclease McrA
MNSKAWYQKNKARKFVTERIRVSKNPEQNRDRLKKHRAENPEMYRNYSGKRRALLLSARQFEVKVSELRKIMSQDCFYCGSQAEHLDHVIPLSRGGLHKIGNLVAACKSCNLTKGAKTIMEWKLFQAKLIQAELKL